MAVVEVKQTHFGTCALNHCKYGGVGTTMPATTVNHSQGIVGLKAAVRSFGLKTSNLISEKASCRLVLVADVESCESFFF